jgi:hypothetical protein
MGIRSLSTFIVQPLTFCAALVITAIAFSSLAKAEPYVFRHAWLDYAGQEKRLALEVGEQRVAQALTNSRDFYNYKDIFREIIRQAKVLANDISTTTAKVRVSSQDMKYEMTFEYREGHYEEALALGEQVKRFIDGAYDDLGSVTYYRHNEELDSLVIDYNEIVGDYRDIFTAVHSYFSRSDVGKSNSAKINDRLAFLQSIPYDDMTKSDFELMTPIRMLAEGRGDCESKQVFLAGLLRQLFPMRSVELVMLPDREHIVTALEVPELPAQWTYTKNGRRYVILDATGPGYSPVSATHEVRGANDFDYGRQIWTSITH